MAMREFLNYLHAQLPGWIGGGFVSALIARLLWPQSKAAAPVKLAPVVADSGVNTFALTQFGEGVVGDGPFAGRSRIQRRTHRSLAAPRRERAVRPRNAASAARRVAGVAALWK